MSTKNFPLLPLHEVVLKGEEAKVKALLALYRLAAGEEAKKGDEEKLGGLLDREKSDVKALQAIHEAVLEKEPGDDRTALLRALLRKELNPNETDSFGRTALELAAINDMRSKDGKLETVRELLGAGADPDTPLVPVAWVIKHWRGDDDDDTLEIVKMFFNKSKNIDKMINSTDPSGSSISGKSLSHLATEDKDKGGKMEELLNSIKEIDLKESFFAAAANGSPGLKSSAERIKKILGDLNDIRDKSKGDGGRTALHLAAENGQKEAVETLLEAGMHPDAWIYFKVGNYVPHYNEDGSVNYIVDELELSDRTALHLAAEKGHETVVEVLLKAGADPNKTYADRDDQGLWAEEDSGTALHLAAEGGHEAAVEALLKADSKPQLNAKSSSGDTALHMAAEYGHEAVVKALLDADPKPQLNADGSDHSPLHLAVKNGHKAVVEALLEVDPKPQLKAKNFRGNTALHLAVGWGHEEIVKKLLEAGADPREKDKGDRTPLHLAAGRGRMAMAIVEALSKANADLEAKDKEGRTPLHHAVAGDYGGHEAVVVALLEAGASPNAKDTKGQTPLHFAAGGDFIIVRGRSVHKEFTTLIRADGSDVDWIGDETNYNYESWMGEQVKIVNRLLEGGANPDERDEVGRTPLRLALTNGHSEILKVLLPVVKDVKEDRDEDGNTILHSIARGYAGLWHTVGARLSPEELAMQESFELWKVSEAKKLIKAGVVPEVQNRYGQTVLHFAAYSNPLLLAELLKREDSKENLGLGCKCNLYYSEGVYDGGGDYDDGGDISYVPFVMLGVDFGLNDDLYRNELPPEDICYFIEKTNVTPLHLSVRRGIGELVKPLLGAGPDLKLADGDGQTPLHWAAECGYKEGDYEEIVKMLLKAGADPKAKDKKGRTPLDLAKDNGHDAIVELLRARPGSGPDDEEG